VENRSAEDETAKLIPTFLICKYTTFQRDADIKLLKDTKLKTKLPIPQKRYYTAISFSFQKRPIVIGPKKE